VTFLAVLGFRSLHSNQELIIQSFDSVSEKYVGPFSIRVLLSALVGAAITKTKYVADDLFRMRGESK